MFPLVVVGSVLRYAAVGEELDAVDVAGIVTCKERCHCGDFVGFADAPQGAVFKESLHRRLRIVTESVHQSLRIGRSWTDDVDPDAEAFGVVHPASHKRTQGTLRRAVDAHPRAGIDGCGGADDHDCAASAHAGKGFLHGQDDTFDVCRELLVNQDRVDPAKRRVHPTTGIGDKNVDPAMLRDNLPDRGLNGCRIGDICRKTRDLAPDALDRIVQRLLPSTKHDHGRPFLSQPCGNRLADAACPACHQGNLVGESVSHPAPVYVDYSNHYIRRVLDGKHYIANAITICAHLQMASAPRLTLWRASDSLRGIRMQGRRWGTVDAGRNVDDDFNTLMRRRRSIRAYLDRPVERCVIEEICRLARTAPSGANLQPGRFHVLTGTALGDLVAGLDTVTAAGLPETSEYSYFPDPMPAHLKARQRAAGYALYQALGIGRRDLDGRRRQFLRNYAFFGAPVGVVVTIDRDMGKGCFMDLGMSLMGFMLATEARGLGTTGIGALANHGPTVHQLLDLPDEEMVVCGIALGWPDSDAPENNVRTEREDLSTFTSFRGF